MANGSRHSLYMVTEASYGVTPASPNLKLLRNTGTTLGLSKDSLQSEEIRSDRQIADFRLSSDSVGGDINFELSLGSFDDLLAGALMSSDWTENVIKAGSKRKSFSLLREFGDLNSADKFFLYSGVEINSMSLTIAASSMVTGSFTVIGKSQSILSAMPTGSVKGEANSNPAMDSFTGSIKEGSSSIAVITEVQISLENGLEPRYVVGSRNTLQPSVGRSNVTGSLSAYFEDATLVKKFINEERTSLEVTLTDGQGGSYTITLPKIVLTGGQPDVSGEGPIILSIPFQAILDPTTGTNILIKRSS